MGGPPVRARVSILGSQQSIRRAGVLFSRGGGRSLAQSPGTAHWPESWEGEVTSGAAGPPAVCSEMPCGGQQIAQPRRRRIRGDRMTGAAAGHRGRRMGRHTRRVGDLVLSVRCDDAYARQAESLLDVVARFRGEGRGLADGVTVQFGFSLLTLRQQGEQLLVCEPDYGGD